MPGPAVLYVLALLLIAAAAGHGAMQQGTLEEALASLTRRTARIAFVFFFVAFTASVWLTWQPNCFTRWLMRNRQHVGLSFATVHFVHLAVLSLLFVVRNEMPDTVTLAGGGLAYLLLSLLVVTSNRAARIRLGRGWRVLHVTGCWYLWIIFAQSYLGRLNPDAGAEPYAMFVVLSAMALAVPVLRTWAWTRRRGRRPAQFLSDSVLCRARRDQVRLMRKPPRYT
jgi:DMSO/TMAO reductase YedYZ heme-binding membrane subunit